MLWLIPLLILILLCLRLFRVKGSSMQPTLKTGDWVLAWAFFVPRRHQVVIVKHGGKLYIKRLIGLPGDHIEVDQDYVYLNHRPLVTPYTDHFSRRKGQWTLGKDQYFVIGDNRRSSVDSRSFGPVDRHQLLARLICQLPIQSRHKGG
ncbi:TPA: signal peptidase I [Streptococcus suis]